MTEDVARCEYNVDTVDLHESSSQLCLCDQSNGELLNFVKLSALNLRCPPFEKQIYKQLSQIRQFVQTVTAGSFFPVCFCFQSDFVVWAANQSVKIKCTEEGVYLVCECVYTGTQIAHVHAKVQLRDEEKTGPEKKAR